MPAKSLFPPFSINESLIIAKTIWENNAGRPMRRVTLFDTLNRQPTSSTSRSLITASSGYGLTQGGYQADTITLTDVGRAIVQNDDKIAKLNAVISIEPFRAFFDHYKDALVPVEKSAHDFLRSQGIPDNSLENCYKIILENGRQVGLIQEMSGRERIVSIAHATENLGGDKSQSFEPNYTAPPIGGYEQPKNDSPGDKGPSYQQLPNLHIDVQIHISADAQPEQIDQIFASMAKHLYSKGE